MALRPREFRLTSTVNQLDRVAWQAVPIILLITVGDLVSQGIVQEDYSVTAAITTEIVAIGRVASLPAPLAAA